MGVLVTRLLLVVCLAGALAGGVGAAKANEKEKFPRLSFMMEEEEYWQHHLDSLRRSWGHDDATKESHQRVKKSKAAWERTRPLVYSPIFLEFLSRSEDDNSVTRIAHRRAITRQGLMTEELYDLLEHRHDMEDKGVPLWEPPTARKTKKAKEAHGDVLLEESEESRNYDDDSENSVQPGSDWKDLFHPRLREVNEEEVEIQTPNPELILPGTYYFLNGFDATTGERKRRVFDFDLPSPNIFEYTKWGEKRDYHDHLIANARRGQLYFVPMGFSGVLRPHCEFNTKTTTFSSTEQVASKFSVSGDVGGILSAAAGLPNMVSVSMGFSRSSNVLKSMSSSMSLTEAQCTAYRMKRHTSFKFASPFMDFLERAGLVKVEAYDSKDDDTDVLFPTDPNSVKLEDQEYVKPSQKYWYACVNNPGERGQWVSKEWEDVNDDLQDKMQTSLEEEPANSTSSKRQTGTTALKAKTPPKFHTGTPAPSSKVTTGSGVIGDLADILKSAENILSGRTKTKHDVELLEVEEALQGDNDGALAATRSSPAIPLQATAPSSASSTAAPQESSAANVRNVRDTGSAGRTRSALNLPPSRPRVPSEYGTSTECSGKEEPGRSERFENRISSLWYFNNCLHPAGSDEGIIMECERITSYLERLSFKNQRYHRPGRFFKMLFFKYGTHYLKKANLGGKLTMTTTVQEEETKQETTKSMTAKMNLKFSSTVFNRDGWLAKSKTKMEGYLDALAGRMMEDYNKIKHQEHANDEKPEKTDEEKEEEKDEEECEFDSGFGGGWGSVFQRSKSMASSDINAIGGRPGTGGSWGGWSVDVDAVPEVINPKYESICDVLEDIPLGQYVNDMKQKEARQLPKERRPDYYRYRFSRDVLATPNHVAASLTVACHFRLWQYRTSQRQSVMSRRFRVTTLLDAPESAPDACKGNILDSNSMYVSLMGPGYNSGAATPSAGGSLPAVRNVPLINFQSPSAAFGFVFNNAPTHSLTTHVHLQEVDAVTFTTVAPGSCSGDCSPNDSDAGDTAPAGGDKDKDNGKDDSAKGAPEGFWSKSPWNATKKDNFSKEANVKGVVLTDLGTGDVSFYGAMGNGVQKLVAGQKDAPIATMVPLRRLEDIERSFDSLARDDDGDDLYILQVRVGNLAFAGSSSGSITVRVQGTISSFSVLLTNCNGPCSAEVPPNDETPDYKYAVKCKLYLPGTTAVYAVRGPKIGSVAYVEVTNTENKILVLDSIIVTGFNKMFRGKLSTSSFLAQFSEDQLIGMGDMEAVTRLGRGWRKMKSITKKGWQGAKNLKRKVLRQRRQNVQEASLIDQASPTHRALAQDLRFGLETF